MFLLCILKHKTIKPLKIPHKYDIVLPKFFFAVS